MFRDVLFNNQIFLDLSTYFHLLFKKVTNSILINCEWLNNTFELYACYKQTV